MIRHFIPLVIMKKSLSFPLQQILIKLVIKLLSFPWFSLGTRFLVAFPWPRFLVQFVIRTVFIKGYGVNEEEAEKSPVEYRTIVDFFVRKLKPPSSTPTWRMTRSSCLQLDAQIMGRGKITAEDYLLD